MREPTPGARPLLNAALATLGLTALHHIYGGLIYGTRWRLHGAFIAILVGIVLMAIAHAYAIAERARWRAVAGYTLVALVVAMPIVAIGAFEGAYNHLVKNVLFLGGAPHDLLVRMFPPPTYELPDDLVFELSGTAQVIPATIAAIAAVRFVRALRRPRACQRPACERVVPLRCLTSINGEPAELPDREHVVHLQFRRFAGCPVCSLHLRSFVRRHAEIESVGIHEVVVFHSTAEELRVHAGELPFTVVADPEKRLYREFGVESGLRSLLDPRVWGTIVVAVLRSTLAMIRGRERPPSLLPRGGRFGLPADFLVAADGRVLACKHGEHADDQWSVDDMLDIVHAATEASNHGRRSGADVDSRGLSSHARE